MQKGNGIFEAQVGDVVSLGGVILVEGQYQLLLTLPSSILQLLLRESCLYSEGVIHGSSLLGNQKATETIHNLTSLSISIN